MKAMVLREQKSIENEPLVPEEIPEPEPGPGEVLVRVRACGVCRTDLHIVEGDLVPPSLPVVPGHQVVGEVIGRGSGAERFREGDRVGIAWLHRTCGECGRCRRGKENLCGKAVFTGFHVNGGYAEYVTVPDAYAYPVPEGLDDVHAAPLLCAGIIGYRALRLTGMSPGEGGNLGMVGFGASAHVCIQIAVHRGWRVYVFSRTEEHRRLAEELGAAWTGELSDTPPVRLDAVVVFAPAGETVPRALELTDKGGTVVLAGIYMTPVPPLSYETHLFHERVLRSVTASTRRDGEELLREAARAGVKTSVETFGLEEANRALEAVKHSAVKGAGVLLP